MAKVEAPNGAYNGTGPGGAVFKDGVAETDDAAALNYYRGAGYKVSGKVDNPVETPEPPDPREVSEVVVGTALRDAAVDPRPEDYLPPTNAGEANPHGSQVVSPEVHHEGPKGIRPGLVADDTSVQQEQETSFATARLVENEPAGKAVADVVDLDDRGPLELSDPGSADQARPADGERPARSASKADWVDYAVAQADPDQADEARDEAEGMTKAELVAKHG